MGKPSEESTDCNEKLMGILKSLTPLQVYILAHLRQANIDYAKSIAKMMEMPIEKVAESLEELEKLGIIERTHGAAIKRTEARFKLSLEVRKHHTYYRLTKEGKHLLRTIKTNNLLGEYLSSISGYNNALELLIFLKKARYEHAATISRVFSVNLEDTRSILRNLVKLNLIAECKPKVLKRKHRKAKPKKETRTQHKYYKLSRLGELLLRYYL